jgi:hypothetical protein
VRLKSELVRELYKRMAESESGYWDLSTTFSFLDPSLSRDSKILAQSITEAEKTFMSKLPLLTPPKAARIPSISTRNTGQKLSVNVQVCAAADWLLLFFPHPFTRTCFCWSSQLSLLVRMRTAASNSCKLNRIKNEPLIHLFAKSFSRNVYRGKASLPSGSVYVARDRGCGRKTFGIGHI